MRLIRAVPMLLLLLLCACRTDQTSAQTPVHFRTGLTESGGCTYQMQLRADYGDYIRDFTLDCTFDGSSASLTVMEPETARGITASVAADGAKVSYDSTVLAVESFETRKISPMAAPYLLGQAWSQGYISSTGMDGDQETVIYTLGYGNETLEITTAFSQGIPVRAEISDGSHNLLTCEISDLTLQKKEVNDHEDVKTNLGGD